MDKMRFDLTNASYRVLIRASKQRLPGAASEISAAKLLMALFEEEECRAADWLAAAGLSLEQFRTAFGLEILQSPISAPGFPMGDYGVPVGQFQPRHQPDPPQIEASAAGKDAPLVGNLPPENFSEEEPKQQHETPPPEREPIQDEWIDSDASMEKRRIYSIYPKYAKDQSTATERNTQSRVLFYLDDQPVHVGRISTELESTLDIILHRFARMGGNKRQIHGITTITNQNRALPLATEHILLAVVLDEGDVGSWLRDNGFDATKLYQRIEEIGQPNEPETTDHEMEVILVTEATEIIEPTEINSTTSTIPGSRGDVGEKIDRLFDAAANRGLEAVRVIEDFVRFILDDRTLTQQSKDFRHEFQDILRSFPQEARLSARNTEEDVGTELEGSGEYRRDSIHDVLAANFGRLQESLRSLEEFSKLREPTLSRRFEKLRYRCYTLHKNIGLTGIPSTIPSVSSQSSQPEIAKPNIGNVFLYTLMDVRNDETEFTKAVKALIDGGVDAIQLRDKMTDDKILLARSKILKEQIALSGRSVLFVMNDRPDLAQLAEADAVHVGQEDLSVVAVRKIVGSNMLIGVSTRCIEQARQAVLEGADYIGAGPVFESVTKEFTEFPGLGYLKQVAAEISIPVFAIGGITANNLDEVLATGVHRIAVGSALFQTTDPQAATEKISTLLRAAQL